MPLPNPDPDQPTEPNTPADDSPTLPDESKTVQDASVPPGAGKFPVPEIPSHELISRVGQGSYGEVWLARNVMGFYRAIKIVYRATFEHARPFEREFNGIKKFEPISRSHDGFVDILQVGRAEDYFYYVMELADDQVTGPQIDPAHYAPKSLRSEMGEKKRLPFEKCVAVGISLTQALGHLHQHGLIHRDIKPSNIIFTNGIPKLADIGLVAEQSEAKSFVGTEGFIPPEGPGTLQADIYSLGKVLYEIATGKDRHDFPELPTLLGEEKEDEHLLELNSVFLKACQSDIKLRYQTAEQMRDDLVLLQSGKSVARAQATERRLALLTKVSLVGVLFTALIVAGFFFAQRQAQRQAKLRARAEAGEREARRNLYAADMALAYQALDIGHLGRARELLQKHSSAGIDLISKPDKSSEAMSPSPSSIDLRSWEWRYLWSQLKRDDLFILGRHEPIAQVALWFPDNRHAVSSGKDGQVKFWDVDARRLLTSLQLPDRVTGLALSRDGKRLATGLPDGRLALWDIASLQPQQVWQTTNSDAIGHLIFSPDATLLAAAGGNLVTVVSAVDGSVRHTLQAMNSQKGFWFKVGLAFSPDSLRLAFGFEGGDLGLLDLRVGSVERFPKPEGGLKTLAFSPNGHTLASGDYAGQITVWDLERRQTNRVLRTHHGEMIVCVDFSPDGKTLASAGGDQTIKLWDTATWEEKATLRGHEFEIWSVAFARDGQRLISAAKDDTVRVWPVKSTPPQPGVNFPKPWPSWSAFTEGTNSQLVLLDDNRRDFKLFELFSGSEVLHGEMPRDASTNVSAWQLLPNQLVVVGSEDGHVEAWDFKSAARLWSVTNHPSEVKRVAGNALRKRLAVAYADGRIDLIGLHDGKIENTFYGETFARLGGSVWDKPILIFSRDGRRLLASPVGAMEIPVWDLDGGTRSIIKIDLREGLVWAALSADGTRLVAASYDDHASLWDVETGTKLARFSGQFFGFRAAAISPDKTRVALGGGDGFLSVWDAQTGQQIANFRGHSGLINFATWDENGDVLATVSGADGLRIWRAPSLAEIRGAERSRGHAGRAPDGQPSARR